MDRVAFILAVFYLVLAVLRVGAALGSETPPERREDPVYVVSFVLGALGIALAVAVLIA